MRAWVSSWFNKLQLWHCSYVFAQLEWLLWLHQHGPSFKRTLWASKWISAMYECKMPTCSSATIHFTMCDLYTACLVSSRQTHITDVYNFTFSHQLDIWTCTAQSSESFIAMFRWCCDHLASFPGPARLSLAVRNSRRGPGLVHHVMSATVVFLRHR